jgi:hypothetical protein
VEREIAFVTCSTENRVSLCGIGVLSGTTPFQYRRTSVTRKELQEYILVSPVSPSRLFLSFTIVSLLAYYFFACLSLWVNSLSRTSREFIFLV